MIVVEETVKRDCSSVAVGGITVDPGMIGAVIAVVGKGDRLVSTEISLSKKPRKRKKKKVIKYFHSMRFLNLIENNDYGI